MPPSLRDTPSILDGELECGLEVLKFFECF